MSATTPAGRALTPESCPLNPDPRTLYNARVRLATTHINADLDGMASLVALSLLEGPLELALPSSMDPSSQRFWKDHGQALPELVAPRYLPKRLEEEELDCLLVVDTADTARLGVIGEYADRFREVRAWDTHPALADDLPREEMPDVSACVSALVLRMAEEGVRPTPTQAGLFLLGIHVDTGHFTFLGTTPLDLRAAALCREWGAPASWPTRYAPRGFTSRQLELLERMAQSTEFLPTGPDRVALIAIELDGYEPDLSVLLEQLREAESWPAAFLLATQGDRTFFIGRSRDRIDVAAVMRTLGGGGHPDAGSAVLRGVNLRDARALVRQTLSEFLGSSRTAGEVAVRPFHSLSASASIREAADALHRFRINALPLTRGRGNRLRVVGLLSRQEVDAALRHGLSERPAADISHTEPVWVSAESPLSEARQALLTGPGRLIMVGDPPDKPVGILTRSTLFRDWATDPPRAENRKPPHRSTVAGLAGKCLGPTWEQVQRLGELGAELGMPVHLVGGTVRDVLLRARVRDIDLVVEGSAPAVARKAVARYGGTLVVHEAFGTARWTDPQGAAIDLASTRSEFYETPAALPSVTRAGLRQDLYRRDFTINAMALSLDPVELGRVRDPFGGLADLHNGTLRVLHGLSFYDDPTRAWRAARFAARLDFRVAPEVLGLMKAARRFGVFDRLGLQRLGAEIELILCEREVEHAFRLLRQWKLLAYIHPKFTAGRRFLDDLGRVRDAWSRLHGLRDDLPPVADALWIVVARQIPQADRGQRSILMLGGQARHRLFVSGPARVEQAIGLLRQASSGSQAGRALSELVAAERIALLGLARHANIERWVMWWEREGRHIGTDVDGHRLKAEGFRPGPAFGEGLQAALDAARDGADAETQWAKALEVVTERVHDRGGQGREEGGRGPKRKAGEPA